MEAENSPGVQGELVSSEVRHVVHIESEVLARVVEALRAEEVQRVKKGRRYPRPFLIDEEFLNKVNEQALKSLNKLDRFPGASPKFVGVVRFEDLTTATYDGFDALIATAGDKKDPESLQIEWYVNLSDPLAGKATITTEFVTEKPLATGALALLEVPVAEITFTVSGYSIEWVENTFDTIDPLISSVSLGGIYKPLWIFRNPALVQMISFATGMMAQFAYRDVLEFFDRSAINSERQINISEILSSPTIDGKFDKFVRKMYGPLKDSPLFSGLMTTASSVVVMFVVYIGAIMLYPKFVPRSGINIGLAKTRYANYENVFRLIFVTIIISGIMVPLVRALLSGR